MNSTRVTSAILLSLMLGGCSALDSLPYLGSSEADIRENAAQGIAITQTRPAELESIRFFTDTPFVSEALASCLEEYLGANQDHTKRYYRGRDVIRTSGTISNSESTLGIKLASYSIDFDLAVLGQHNGSHYGFSQLRLARSDKLKLNSHAAQPILANSSSAKRAYLTLRQLFISLDKCVQETTVVK
ncbi:hypothetical protein [Oceanisphaera avium]|uniref:ABC-type transport auxiliary lipoprotein component domain-containing protein n=1 Tax=Oceanisphaera avium TaxID=1903694 RepID=A0A1Y0CVZ2_9GAMM|nr:hypothetical protein [Oceanisphaera avium]ART79501.1 hypothetical protein CBP12_04500 [Oceanisphaera avium]